MLTPFVIAIGVGLMVALAATLSIQYGRQLLGTSQVYDTRVSYDGSPRYKGGGITLDTATLAAAPGSDTTLPDGSVIKAGQQYLRFGQILCKITAGTQQTLTGTATAGNFTLTLYRPDTGQNVTTGNIAFNASAATVLAAIQAVMGPGQAVSSSGGALGTAAVTVVFGAFVPIMVVNAGTLTGGTVTPAVTVVGASANKYGPYDPGASDGRQTLTRGECWILDQTWLATPGGNLAPSGLENIGGVLDGGRVWKDRIMHSGVAAASAALGPTYANVLTAFPAIQPMGN